MFRNARLVTAAQEVASGLKGPVRYFITLDAYKKVHGNTAEEDCKTVENRMAGTVLLAGVARPTAC